MKRVVVTGLGALTPIGNDVNSFWDNLVKGVSGAGTISYFDASKFRTQIAAELKDFDIKEFVTRQDLKRTDLYTQYGFVAADQALLDSGLEIDKEDPFDIGVIWGTGQGGLQTVENEVTQYALGDGTPRYNPFTVPKMLSNMASGMISLRHGLMGVNYTAVSACATSNTALMEAFNLIRLNKAKVIIAGGSEAPIHPVSIGGFAAMKAMTQQNDDPSTACKPFDKDRDGFLMGEGAGAIILEDLDHALARGAKIYCEMVGAAMTTDAYHMTSTHPEGKGAIRAMHLALEEAQLQPSDVDYLNAHATSTGVGDLSETHAAFEVFGADGPYVSATKSMTGHLLGAAGAIEGIAAIKAITEGIVPPTINTKNIDEGIPSELKLVLGKAVHTKIDVAMSNTFGFGGHNATVVFKRFG